MSASGIATYTALGAAINAGFTTLASQAAVSFINNSGDLGKTLHDMGDSRVVKTTLASMLTAGLSTYVGPGALGVVANSAAGCASSEFTGGDCKQGAEIKAGGSVACKPLFLPCKTCLF